MLCLDGCSMFPALDRRCFNRSPISRALAPSSDKRIPEAGRPEEVAVAEDIREAAVVVERPPAVGAVKVAALPRAAEAKEAVRRLEAGAEPAVDRSTRI